MTEVLLETGGKEEMCMVVGKGLESGELYQLSVQSSSC